MEAALDLRAKGRIQDALRVLSRAAVLSPESCNLQGDLQFEVGHIAEAIGAYFGAIAIDGENVYAHFQLARCLCRLKHWDEAAARFRQVLSCDARRDDARIGLGQCLLQLNRPEEARSCFEACRSAAARTNAAFGRAVAFQSLRRFDEAEVAYQGLLASGQASEPLSNETLSNLVAMSVEMFDLERIRRYSQRLLERDARSTIALQGLALVALERREDQAAADYLSRIETPGREDASPAGGNGDGIEYRLSHEMLGRLRQARTRRASSEFAVDRSL